MTPELRRDVLARDRGCVLAKLDAKHLCRDRWAYPHGPEVLYMLSIEHVHEGYGRMGRRAPSDMAHCVALCHGANLKPPSRDERALLRDYLASVAAWPA